MAKRALFWAAVCLLALGPARGDLTDRLVKDSDTMANIVGASETMSLVDYKLHKVPLLALVCPLTLHAG